MKSLLLITFPTRSHINGLLILAHFFKTKGYDVYFVINDSIDIGSYVNKQGFKYVVTNSIPFGLPWRVKLTYFKKRKSSLFHHYLNQLRSSDFEKRCNQMNEIISRIKPTAIFIDTFVGGDFLCVYSEMINSKIKLSFVNTMGIFVSKGMPPPDSTLSPDRKIQISLTNFIRIFKVNFIDFLARIIFLNQDSMTSIYSKMKDLGIPQKNCIIANKPLGITFIGYTEYVLGSRAFDYPITASSDELNNRRYLGMSVYSNRVEMITPTYKAFNEKVPESSQVIFISFGSLSREKISRVHKLISLILEASRNFPDYLFIVSSPVDSNNLMTSRNVYFFKSVHQLAELSRSKIFITHGGFNSIKEGIHFQVPMIVYPINSDYDQVGNAARVKYHKIGLAESNVDKETSRGLIEKINTLLSNHNFYKSNIRLLFEMTRDEPSFQEIDIR